LICIILAACIIKVQAVPTLPADSFVESIDVNTHWAYSNVYSHNYTGLKAKLAESGIRYVRDGTYLPVFARAIDLYDSLGIKTNMLTGRNKPGPGRQPLDPTQIDEELNEIKTQALSATVSLEAPNEYDLSRIPDWVEIIKNYSTVLYNKAKADQILRNIPVIGPSLVFLESYEAVGNGDSYIDYGNQHMYQWTFWPGFAGGDTNGSRSITWYLDKLALLQSPSGKRVQATEAGYTNYVEVVGLSEEADGKYMPRVFAEFFRRGVYRTYKYELVNQGQPGREGVYGLLRNDLSEKPSFRAVKNLIAILSDKGPSFEPDTLSYVLNGSMDNVRQILFQKRNGDFYLMVWLEVSSWDVNAKIDLYPPPQQVVLTLQGSNRISSATLYAFNNNADVNTTNLTINNNQVTFNVTDKISIIKLSNSSTSSISHGVYRLTSKDGFHSCHQLIVVGPMGDGFYRLTNRANGQVLHLNECKTNDCQKWKFELLSDGYYRITSKNAHDQCLGVRQCSLTGSIPTERRLWSNTDCEHYWKLDWIASTV
jgi:hypothetical protein